jgi:hypothetical protein
MPLVRTVFGIIVLVVLLRIISGTDLLAEFKGITSLNQVTKSRLLQLNFRLVKTKQMILNSPVGMPRELSV